MDCLDIYDAMSVQTFGSGIPVEIYKANPLAIIPTRSDEDAAAYDLYSVVDDALLPGGSCAFSTGLIMRPAEGWHIKIFARSGIAKEWGIHIPHSVGIVDRNFCGPDDIVQVRLTYPSKEEHKNPGGIFYVKAGDRIAQMMVERTNNISWKVLDYPPSNQSRGGFGASGGFQNAVYQTNNPYKKVK